MSTWSVSFSSPVSMLSARNAWPYEIWVKRIHREIKDYKLVKEKWCNLYLHLYLYSLFEVTVFFTYRSEWPLAFKVHWCDHTIFFLLYSQKSTSISNQLPIDFKPWMALVSDSRVVMVWSIYEIILMRVVRCLWPPMGAFPAYNKYRVCKKHCFKWCFKVTAKYSHIDCI